MYHPLPKLKNISNKIALSILIFSPIITSCSSSNNQSLEIITPPILPNEFSKIPNDTTDPNLKTLSSAKETINAISVGRDDPFLPPNVKIDELLVPETFQYHGQIASKDYVSAFVSYKNRSGVIKPGDIGGKSTNLLPNNWIMEKIDIDKQVLTLSFKGSNLNIDLFNKN